MPLTGNKGPSNALISEYSRTAETYEDRWFFYVTATTGETLKRLKVRPADRVLDVGCGTGALLRRLAASHPTGQLTGVDPVPGMLAVARRHLGSEITLLEGWAEALPVPAERYDVVVSCNMFHYLQEPMNALAEMHRVLRPGGRLVITDWCDDFIACRICDWYLRLVNRAHVKTYRVQACTAMLEQAGFLSVAADRYKISWLWGLMTVTVQKP